MPAQSNSAPTLRPVAPDREIRRWLWTEEGLDWHNENIRRIAHASGVFAEVKYDHECSAGSCAPQSYSPHPDAVIANEIRVYGISGVPEEWKQHWRSCNRA